MIRYLMRVTSHGFYRNFVALKALLCVKYFGVITADDTAIENLYETKTLDFYEWFGYYHPIRL